MTDDDRRLADRLRAYESRVPVPAQDAPTTRLRRMPLIALAAAVGVLAMVVTISTGLLRSEPATGEGSPTPAEAPTGAPTRSPNPTPTGTSTPGSSATAEPTLDPSGQPSPTLGPEPIATWRMTASFDTDPATSWVTDVVGWDGGFVAVGGTWPSAYRGDREAPRLWTSPDGETWTEQPIDLGVDEVSLRGIARRADGMLLLVGVALGSGGNPDALYADMKAWISSDAQEWAPVELPLAAGLAGGAFAHGPLGYALTAGGELWYSADGITWTKTHDSAAGVVAGLEGFVAIMVGDDGETDVETTTLIASADGRTWYESEPLTGSMLGLAPVGGDWLVLLANYGDGVVESHTVVLWHSANGLSWTPSLDLNDLTGPDGPKTGRGLSANALNVAALSGGSGRAFMTLQDNHCCAQPPWNYGVWSSTDGFSWTLAVEGDAYVSSVANVGGTEVAVGHLGRGDDAAFWIGERP